MVISLFCLVSCAVANHDYQQIVDDCAIFTLQQDADSAAFDAALDSVGQYLDDSSQETLEETLQFILATYEQMEAESASIVSYELSESMSQLLIKYDIDPEEYKINADMRAIYLSGYISNLEYLIFYLELEALGDTTREDLEFTYQSEVVQLEAQLRFGKLAKLM